MKNFSFAKMSVLTCIGLGLTCLPGLNADMNSMPSGSMMQKNATDTTMSKDARDLGVKVEQTGNYNDDSNDDDDVSDSTIMGDVKDVIGPGVISSGYENVKATVNDGNVVLTGSVKTQGDKEKIEKKIRDIDGVDRVDSQITVQEMSTKANATNDFSKDIAANSADKQLNEKIRDKVSRGWLWDSYKDVTLNTNDGVVTLEGQVGKTSDQEKLVNEIQKIEGVKSVNSRLVIKDVK